MTKRKFYKTIVTVEVLSEEPIGDIGLDELEGLAQDMAITAGRVKTARPKVLNGKQMADALYKQASEPSFFMLDDKGNDSEGDEEDEDHDRRVPQAPVLLS